MGDEPCGFIDNTAMGKAVTTLVNTLKTHEKGGGNAANAIDAWASRIYVCISHSYCTLIHFPIGNYSELEASVYTRAGS
jgi:hypothetical protein